MIKPLAAWKLIFSDNLKAAIAATGLTDNDFRQKAGYSSQTWYCYKNGTRIPSNPSDIENLAAVAGINPAQFFGWDSSGSLPSSLYGAEHLTLSTPQLDYPAGAVLYYAPGTFSIDGVYIVKPNGSPIIRRLSQSLGGGVIASDGTTEHTYPLDELKSLPILGRVIGVTALI